MFGFGGVEGDVHEVGVNGGHGWEGGAELAVGWIG